MHIPFYGNRSERESISHRVNKLSIPGSPLSLIDLTCGTGARSGASALQLQRRRTHPIIGKSLRIMQVPAVTLKASIHLTHLISPIAYRRSEIRQKINRGKTFPLHNSEYASFFLYTTLKWHWICIKCILPRFIYINVLYRKHFQF